MPNLNPNRQIGAFHTPYYVVTSLGILFSEVLVQKYIGNLTHDYGRIARFPNTKHYILRYYCVRPKAERSPKSDLVIP
jgi:hypothetical protein